MDFFVWAKGKRDDSEKLTGNPGTSRPWLILIEGCPLLVEVHDILEGTSPFDSIGRVD